MGSEPAIRAAGPMFGLLGFALFPFVWSVQEALVTAQQFFPLVEVWEPQHAATG